MAASSFFKMRQILITMIFVGLWSCYKIDNKSDILTEDTMANEPVYFALTLDEYKTLYKLETYLATIEDSTAEIVDFDCAILIYPTEQQIEEMKAIQGEYFYSVDEENNLRHKAAIRMIDSIGIKTVTTKAQYLRLKGRDKTWNLDIRKEMLPSWNLIFFRTTKEPKVLPVISLTTDQVSRYFGI